MTGSTDYDSGTVDLTNCDREPIHILGRVQQFGALIAVNSDWLISHHSDNLGRILQTDIGNVIGRPLFEIFSKSVVETLRTTLAARDDAETVARLFDMELVDNERQFDIVMHRSGARIIVEIEPHRSDEDIHQLAGLRGIVGRMGRDGTVQQLCDSAVRELREMVGFDRVMTYCFHPDGSGEVIAEDRDEQYDSFLSLRYPHTDIPQQARALYVRNQIRIIADVDEETSPILPAESLDDEPLDLNDSILRAVSPIHIEYLKNMGVAASLSISIVIDGKLWGLFACHHYSPRTLPYSIRTMAEMFAQLFSLSLGRALSNASRELRDRGRALHDRLMIGLAGGVPLVEGLPTLDNVIGTAIPHTGSSAFVDDVYRASGKAPTEEEFRAIVPALNGSRSSRIIGTNSLSTKIAAAKPFMDRATGALIIPVSRKPRDFFILWREELPQTIKWGGKPEKNFVPGPNGPRLSPRESFAEWQETVTGISSDWTEDELQIAESIRVTLLEVILRMTDEAVQERAKAQEQQELLIAELNHRVRNILNLIKSVINQSQKDAVDIPTFSDIIGGRIGSLAAAHDNITRGSWSPASITELIETEAQAYTGGQSDRVTITGEDVLIPPEAYTVVALVIHEMMTNSAKYGSLCDSSGLLDIDLTRRENGDLAIDWTERGGPPVQAPKRRGFGTTIIERSIPFELKGTADLKYNLKGVNARFTIPARYITAAQANDKTVMAMAATKTENTAERAKDTLPERILLVEDSMLIALDTEDCLEQLGVENVSVIGNVIGALDRIETFKPQMAILDFNLGSESSEPVARELVKRDIPFVLATGYGEMADKLEEIGAMGLLKKPYGIAELEMALTLYANR